MPQHLHQPCQCHCQRFTNRVVIVTGSSSGIGRDAAVEFAKEGASVVIHGQNLARLDETERQILASGVPTERILKVAGPLEQLATAHALIDETIGKFGKINVLVNNAGAGSKPGNTDPSSLYLLDYLYAVNYRSVVQLTQLALPHLSLTKGSIVNVSSMASIRMSAVGAFYGSIKAALDAWTKTMSYSYAQIGVRINCVNPGYVETPILDRNIADPEKASQQKQKMIEWAKVGIPLGRIGTTSEICTILTFLASDAASYVTGACWLADGGCSSGLPELTT